MNKVHPVAQTIATDFGYPIDESTGSMDVSANGGVAVIVNLRDLHSSAVSPEEVVSVPSSAPDESILFFSYSHVQHLTFSFVRLEHHIEIDRWNWSKANHPEPWEMAPEPWHHINQYVASLSEKEREAKVDEVLQKFEAEQQCNLAESKKQARKDAEVKKREREKQEEERQRRQKESLEKHRDENLSALPKPIRSYIEAGLTHGLTYDAWDAIDGPYRFVKVDHLDSADQCEEEPQPGLSH